MTAKLFTKIFSSAFILLILFLFIFSKNSLAITPTPTPSVVKAVLPQITAGETTIINTPVDRDLFVAGRQVDINTNVSGDAYIAGGQVNIKGQVNGNLIIAGGNVTVSGIVKRNLIIAGGQVNVEKSAIIDGYILGAGNELIVSGTVNGPARFASNSFVISNTAQIIGDLEVYANDSNIDPGAKILGQKRISQPPQSEVQPRPNLSNRLGDQFSAFNLFLFLAQILVLIVLIRILIPHLLNFIDPLLNSPLNMLGWGLIRLVVLPFLAIILFLTIIGIPLGVLTIFIYGLGLYLSTLISGVALGRWLFQKKWINNENLYLQSVVGYLIIFIIGWIPFIGIIIKFIALLFGLGIIFQWEKSLFNKKTA